MESNDGLVQIKSLQERLYEAQQLITVQKAIIEKQDHAIQKHGAELLKAKEEIEQSEAELLNRQKIIVRQNRDTIDSILYARHIQQAMLPKVEKIKEVVPESFVLFRPRDIVSGDFYWFNTKSHRTIISAIDCTGHGVPGAFLSMIGNELLNKIVNFKGISEPDKVLNQLHLEMRHTLQQKENGNEDGMDITMCTIHQVPEEMEDLFGKPRLEFAGAKNSLVYVQDGELHEIRGDKVPVGGFLYEEDHRFTKYVIPIDKPTVFYLFSDGFQDQFGGPQRRKFMVTRFRSLLFEIHDKPMAEQERILAETLDDWMGEYAQLDDILVIGVKLEGKKHKGLSPYFN
jgi:serine phosphatase RsbU (regulator of sigma subunit)